MISTDRQEIILLGEEKSDKAGGNRNSLFWLANSVGKVTVVLFLHLLDLSAFPPFQNSDFLELMLY